MKTLLPFQQDAVTKMLNFLLTRSEAACYNASEQGCGKSVMTSAVANELLKQNKIRKILVICPAVMKYVWQDEFSEWDIKSVVIDTSKELKTLEAKIKLRGDSSDAIYSEIGSPAVVICSYDLARSSSEFLSKQKFHLLVCDEAHFLKNRKAIRTKNILENIWPSTLYRIALSGTPFTTNIVDGYTLFNKMHPAAFSNFYQFAATYSYFKMTPFGPKYYGVKNAQQLSSLIRDNFYVRYIKSQVLTQLPDKVFHKIPLPAKYAVMPEKDAKEVLNREVAAVISSLEEDRGFVLPKNLAEHRRMQGEKKIEPIVEWLSDQLENNIPVVCFAYHRSVIAKLVEHFKAEAPAVITGDTSAQERFDAVQKFQSGGTNLFIGQINAAGVGITLTRSSTVCLAELDWSPAVLAQAWDRVHRIGQVNTVDVYYFVVKDSLDESINNVVVNRARIFKKVLDGEGNEARA